MKFARLNLLEARLSLPSRFDSKQDQAVARQHAGRRLTGEASAVDSNNVV
jgi:hypothetical protein